MRRAPEAEEAVGLRIGVLAQRDHPPYPRLRKTVRDIGSDVELGMAGAATVGEKALIFGISLTEARDESVVDLIGGACDARPDRRYDPAAIGTQCEHCIKLTVGHAADRAFPAGMRRAYDARIAICEQHGHAVGSQYAEKQARRRRHQSVGMGPCIVREVFRCRHAIRRIHLVQRDEPVSGCHGLDRSAAILHYGIAIVIGAEADIEAGMDALRNPALASQKAVGQAIERRNADGDRPIAHTVGFCVKPAATMPGYPPPRRGRHGLRASHHGIVG